MEQYAEQLYRADTMIETESTRLVIRRLSVRDANFMLQLLNDPGFIDNIADRGVRTEAQAKVFIQEGAIASYEQYGFGPYVIELKDSGEALGTCGFYQRDIFSVPDIGYALLAQYSAKGYALEAALSVRDFGAQQLGIAHLLGITSDSNKRSRFLLEKLGLSYRGNILMQGYQDQSLVYLSD